MATSLRDLADELNDRQLQAVRFLSNKHTCQMQVAQMVSAWRLRAAMHRSSKKVPQSRPSIPRVPALECSGSKIATIPFSCSSWCAGPRLVFATWRSRSFKLTSARSLVAIICKCGSTILLVSCMCAWLQDCAVASLGREAVSALGELKIGLAARRLEVVEHFLHKTRTRDLLSAKLALWRGACQKQCNQPLQAAAHPGETDRAMAAICKMLVAYATSLLRKVWLAWIWEIRRLQIQWFCEELRRVRAIGRRAAHVTATLRGRLLVQAILAWWRRVALEAFHKHHLRHMQGLVSSFQRRAANHSWSGSIAQLTRVFCNWRLAGAKRKDSLHVTQWQEIRLEPIAWQPALRSCERLALNDNG